MPNIRLLPLIEISSFASSDIQSKIIASGPRVDQNGFDPIVKVL